VPNNLTGDRRAWLSSQAEHERVALLRRWQGFRGPAPATADSRVRQPANG
jgi:hypothetical protein